MEIIRYIRGEDLDLFFNKKLSIKTLILHSFGDDSRPQMKAIYDCAEIPIKIIIPDKN